ncbi:SGNH/GDSL hydrolase family protein [Heyndrickxia sporothermodurans]|uniref:SGNH/GDSL hydrolase family protein n=1 Tax=Heyndrickxia sporothermodurans TaxID=46224 RepID=UPI003D20F39E
MKKKIIIINVVALIILCLFTTIFQLQTQRNKTDKINELKKESKEKLENRKVILLLGSSVTQGLGASLPQNSWAGLLNTYLTSKNPGLVFLNLGVGGYTTLDIVNSSLRITSNLNSENLNPDIIIFETCLINDFIKLNSSQSKRNIAITVFRLQKQFPNAKIYLIPPNNVTVYNGKVNSEGMSYQEYVKNIGFFISAKGWNYIDFWSLYENEYKQRGQTLRDTLGKDGKHPNNIGYKIWFRALTKEIKFNDSK